MKNDITTIKWVYQQSKSIVLNLILLTVLGISVSFCSVSFAYISKNVLDIATGNSDGSLLLSIINIAILIFVQLILQVLISTLSIKTSGKLTISIRKNLFENLLTKDYANISNYHSGDLINRINSDVSVITSAVVGIIPGTITFLARIILSFCYLYVLDPTFAIMCLAIGPLVLIVSQIYRKKMKILHKKCQETDGKTRSFMQECLQNILVIKSFGNENIITKHSTILQNENFKFNIKRNNVSIIANLLFYLTVTIGYYFALAWGAYKLSKGLITVGTLNAMLQLVGQIQTPFRSLSSTLPQYYTMIASSERIIEIETLKNDIIINESDLNYAAIYHDMDEIVLDNVKFGYNSNIILNNTSLRIKKGEFVAICGSSGIGKSTLLKLLLGIISPTSGDIYIKSIRGDKTDLDSKTRRIFAYVPQGNMILSGTIRDNITFASEKADDEYIIRCAKVARIWDFINSLPNKLDTALGENGLGLSEGQVQRIAIARAIFHNAPIILLDEATSGLDEKTEAEVLCNIKNLKDKTCIIVSHRRTSFEICHKVVHIDNGNFELESHNKL